MKTITVIIGVVILVIGIALIAVGALGTLGSLTIVNTFNQPNTGEYVSPEIILNSTSTLVVSSPSSSGGIIPAGDLNSVSSSNINSYAIQYNSSAAGSDVYRRLAVGDYYYVAFASNQPDARIVVTPVGSSIVRFGLLVIAGLVLVVVGIVVAIVGVIQKNKRPAEPHQP